MLAIQIFGSIFNIYHGTPIFMLHHYRFRDFFGTVLGIFGLAFVRAPSESSLFPGIVHRRHQPGVYGSTGAKYERKRQPENRTAESVARKSGALARGTTENQVPQRCFDFSFHRLLVVPWCSVPRMLMSLAIRPTLQYWGWASLEISVNFFVSLELFRILTGSARLKPRIHIRSICETYLWP